MGDGVGFSGLTGAGVGLGVGDGVGVGVTVLGLLYGTGMFRQLFCESCVADVLFQPSFIRSLYL